LKTKKKGAQHAGGEFPKKSKGTFIADGCEKKDYTPSQNRPAESALHKRGKEGGLTRRFSKSWGQGTKRSFTFTLSEGTKFRAEGEDNRGKKKRRGELQPILQAPEHRLCKVSSQGM